MGLFAGGVMLDNRTRYSRAVTGATLRAVDPVTGEALATFSAEFPDNPKTVTTNGNGAYEDFIVPDYDVIRIEASGVSQSMVSQEAQVAAGNAGPFLESAEQRLSDLESRSGTSVTALDNGDGTATLTAGATILTDNNDGSATLRTT